MEHDRQKFGKKEPEFSQLFVARSPRLCRYVENNIGTTNVSISKFTTFNKVIEQLEKVLPKVKSVRDEFPDGQLMNFSKFKREIYDGSGDVDALIVWTNIRSFIKGSIEALKNPNCFIAEEEFFSHEHFGKKRCRFSMEQRRFVYKVFVKYQGKMKEHDLWDNCDRIVSLIQRLQSAKTTDPLIFQGDSWCKWSKIYVDEVQDYTQGECLLFFHLSGAGNLFLAGDPAQNVVRGVEFRFEDIRSVGYHVAGNKRDLIPQKPKIVNVNFRSHAGILGCGE
jgi:superfamily I DNA/RNA helicase|eukprot:scaffold10220_cov272-Chaetoceros_neogracile.AAC.57